MSGRGVLVDHLGFSGLRLTWSDGAVLTLDPPNAETGPLALTWSEQERTAGVRVGAKGPIAADPRLLRWLRREGAPLSETAATLAGFELRAFPYTPIPWATPTEALRKTASGLRRPRLAVTRLAYTLRRPSDPPLILDIRRGGLRVVHLGQSLHRFLSPGDAAALVGQFGGADLLLAGTDFDDEGATGRLLGKFQPKRAIVVDLVGDVRRQLGLPTRPLTAVLPTAAPGLELLPSPQSGPG